MTGQQWTPRTREDRLLAQYLTENPGLLFLEVEVGGTDPLRGARRLDGVLIPGQASRVETFSPQNREAFADEVAGSTVHVLEAKRHLNRNVIGQVEVGVALFERDFAPCSIRGVAVCAFGNADLEWYCRQKAIAVSLFPYRSETRDRVARSKTVQRVDRRNRPDESRKRAFMRGWEAAIEGRLFGSIRRRKTHANMGNLFGWIYGAASRPFREATWERYVASMELEVTEDEIGD
jgi:hypothetical protein